MDQLEQIEAMRGVQRGFDDFAAERALSLGEFRRRMERRFAVDRRKRGR